MVDFDTDYMLIRIKAEIKGAWRGQNIPITREDQEIYSPYHRLTTWQQAQL